MTTGEEHKSRYAVVCCYDTYAIVKKADGHSRIEMEGEMNSSAKLPFMLFVGGAATSYRHFTIGEIIMPSPTSTDPDDPLFNYIKVLI
jgi:hypothetical protein